MKKIELRSAYLWIFFVEAHLRNEEKLFIESIKNRTIF